jgi:hypothetical protein
MSGAPIDLDEVLLERAQAPDVGQVWIPGGWVERVPTVPLEGGVQAVVRFAWACWVANLELQQELINSERARGAAA